MYPVTKKQLDEINLKPKIWQSLDPNIYIDYNPTIITTSSHGVFIIFRRDRYPLAPGSGSIWIIQVNNELAPTSKPHMLIEHGEDPRAIVFKDIIYIFYCRIEKNDEGRYTGSQIYLAEYKIEAGIFKPYKHSQLKKNPIGLFSPKERGSTWEKNWVPFVNDQGDLLAIYSHHPWKIIKLKNLYSEEACNISEETSTFGIEWDFGIIRGSTPAVAYGSDQLISFFHSSCVIGSRKLYFVGAVTFKRISPYQPIAYTPRPLLIAPYNKGAHRFGWPIAASVIFPGGAKECENCWRIAAGVDDGEIGIFDIGKSDLADRLEPISKTNQIRFLYGVNENKNIGCPLFESYFEFEPQWHLSKLILLASPRQQTCFIINCGSGEHEFFLSKYFENIFYHHDNRSIVGNIKYNINSENINTTQELNSCISDNSKINNLPVSLMIGPAEGINQKILEIIQSNEIEAALVHKASLPFLSRIFSDIYNKIDLSPRNSQWLLLLSNSSSNKFLQT